MTDTSRTNARGTAHWDPLGNALGIAGTEHRHIVARERRLAAAAAIAAESPLAQAQSDPLTAKLLAMIAKANSPDGGEPRRADFNSELLWQSLDAPMRAALASTLHRFVAAGLLRRRAHGEYSVAETAMARSFLEPAKNR